MDRTVPTIVLLAVVLLGCPRGLFGQEREARIIEVPSDWESPANRMWLSAQANVIYQQHQAFDARYSGPASLLPRREGAASQVETLYGGFQFTKRLAVLCDLESVGGTALSGARGLGALTNVDVPQGLPLGRVPYVSRAMLHYTLPLSGESALVTRNPLSLAPTMPVRRLEIRAGKMSAVDFFDLNAVGSDSHSQFTNLAVVNNGAYDYPADARGYTVGIVAEYYDRSWALRLGEMLMPAESGGQALEWNVGRAGSTNAEVEYHASWPLGRPGVFRALAFVNHAAAARYGDAVDGFLSGRDAAPDTSRNVKSGRAKMGVGLNAEHQLSPSWRAFWRIGWNDGATDTWAIDRTFQAGADVSGDRWRRAEDKAGVAVVVNALSADHRRYLELGGQASGLGDGRLTYGPERVVEVYYNAQLFRGVAFAIDYQLLTHPGYNRDRGPASVVGFRFHLEQAIPFERLRARD